MPFAERVLDTLSSGERQRVWIATALAQQTPTLLFDEPTSHLDLGGAYATLDILRGLVADGAAIAVVLHDLNLAVASVDRIVLVGDGTVLADGPVDAVFRADCSAARTVRRSRCPHTADGMLVAVPRRRAGANAR